MSEREEGGRNRFQWTEEDAQAPERAIVLVPDFQIRPDGEGASERSREARLAEACGLARAIDLDIVESGIVPVKAIKPGTLFGTGKIDEIAGIIKAGDIGLAVIDHALSPVQQRNMEKAWNCKVLDRTGLILEIFGDRARTKEGRLQVDLAQLNYQKGRLVRQWTHLERQRGGAGFMGGPGETQIEADRREIQAKILKLERELEKVRKTRQLHRSTRRKVPHPVVALVGYTNAGKSTLFNHMTGAGVLAKDMLFATLDPTLRQLELPQGTRVILSDTVGFVSNLPTHLVAAFRATLEEVIEADLILHVRDISDPDTEAQASDVYDILEQLGVGQGGHEKVIEVWNKIDRLAPEAVEDMRSLRSAGQEAPFLVSAITGEGIEPLRARIEEIIAGEDAVFTLAMPPAELARLSALYDKAVILERDDLEDGSVMVKVRAPESIRQQYSAFMAEGIRQEPH
ncbi:MAG: GTPase HflX [Nitratireductor sp.]|nr:GTPase HflX [Nitratireductor sp.]MCC0019567.1 GTPase HflX [Nitratireductor sp.]